MHALLICCGYLAVFLAGKLILNSNPGLSLRQWLADTSPLNHSYLFGWLIAHERYLKYSVVFILPALFGKNRFSAATFTGFAGGLLLGEVYDFFWGHLPYTGFPYPWRIWFFSCLISIAVGIILELRRKKA